MNSISDIIEEVLNRLGITEGELINMTCQDRYLDGKFDQLNIPIAPVCARNEQNPRRWNFILGNSYNLELKRHLELGDLFLECVGYRPSSRCFVISPRGFNRYSYIATEFELVHRNAGEAIPWEIEI